MVQQAPLGPQQPVQRGEVLAGHRRTDVLEHADRGDRVERVLSEVAVVLQADRHLSLETGLGHSLTGQGGLLRADRDPDHLHPVLARRVDRHRAPAAADVEQARARALVQAELAAHQLVLGRLRRGEVHRRLDEPGARVGHRRPEDHAVEVVAHVVVVVDGVRVALAWCAAGPGAPGAPRAAVAAAARTRRAAARRRRRPAQRGSMRARSTCRPSGRSVSRTAKMSPSMSSSPAT